MNIGFIGVGNLASSIITGIRSSDAFCNEKLFLYDKIENKASAFAAAKTQVCSNEAQVIENSDYIFVAIKPADFSATLKTVRENCDCRRKVFISTAAAVTTQYISQKLGGALVIRTMPNLPISCGVGATAVCAGDGISEQQLAYVVSIFSASGKCCVLQEKDMNKVIAVNGSSPAYVFMMADAMIQWAQSQGFDYETAKLLTAQAIKGSAEMLSRSAQTPQQLTQAVCSPGGTTVEAVNVLRDGGFYDSMKRAMDACTTRADAMTQQQV